MGNETVQISSGWAVRTTDIYGIVLLFLLLLLVVPGLVPPGNLTDLTSAILATAAIVLSMVASGARRWVIWAALGLSGIGTLLAAWPHDDTITTSIGSFVFGFVLILTPLLVVNRIARHQVVTTRTVLGGLCVYFQIGFAFAFLFSAIERIDPNQFANLAPGNRVAFSYFSFVTLSTLGYGDITPVRDAARVLAVLETTLGQLFLVVVIARLVSLQAKSSNDGLTDSETRSIARRAWAGFFDAFQKPEGQDIEQTPRSPQDAEPPQTDT